MMERSVSHFFNALELGGESGINTLDGGPSVVVDNDDKRSQLELCSHICLCGSHICFMKPLHLSRLHFSTYKMD